MDLQAEIILPKDLESFQQKLNEAKAKLQAVSKGRITISVIEKNTNEIKARLHTKV